MDHQPDDLVGNPVDDVPTREPGEYCNARRTREGTFVGYCKRTSGWGTERESGRCSSHGGSGGSGDGHEGNNWAATHGAYSDSFVQDFLTEEEIKRVQKAEDLLEKPESAQALARTVAGITLEQFRRTGDERFLRRMESICDTFGVTPDESVQVEHSGTVEHDHTHELTDKQRSHLDALTGGTMSSTPAGDEDEDEDGDE